MCFNSTCFHVIIKIGDIMKKIIILLISIFITTACDNNTIDNLDIDFNIDSNETELNYDTKNPLVAMQIENYGAIVIELYPEYAPNTVNNFITLVKDGFYDNNNFHRLVKNFVLQGGDPNGDGTGGPGYKIYGEFKDNGYYKNTLKHERGTVSMARSSLPNSAGSQFFICLEATSNLDDQYAAFGKVIDGMEIIDKIEANELVADSNTGKLQNNLIITKALVDIKNYELGEVEKN